MCNVYFQTIQEVSGVRFEHMKLSGITFTTNTYGWSLKKNNSGVYLKNGMKGKIQSILQLGHGNQATVFFDS